ncbi:uncharacterized protein LOC136716061 [Amia ocellicauda]|uniref:uncharacterized protein LOC136716061 n=1 Tax=Amia ocellicauda TaxID=2972642 RepID=UPI003464B941
MALKEITGLLVCIFLSKVFTSPADCPPTSTDYESLSATLKNFNECFKSDTWKRKEIDSFLGTLKTATDLLQIEQEKSCKNFTPEECPVPQVPSGGGLLCLTLNNTRFCKPMCNQGYDFSFLRRSRLYEECGHLSKQWTTQYVGGNTLAVCQKSDTQISGAKGSYFPKDQDCRKMTFDNEAQEKMIKSFIDELTLSGINGMHLDKYDCLICG